MWIKKIKFDDFIIFKNQAFWFTPGLNLIYGPNEAGKTSLLEGIKWSLFGKKGRKKLKNKIEITLVLSEGKEIIINDGLPFFLNMGVDLFENIYFVHTAELDFKEPKRFLTHLKAKLLNLDLLEQAKSEIKELIGKDLQVLNQRILKTGLINERIKGLKEERDQLEHERKLYIEIRTMEHNKRTLEAEERQLKQALSRWEEKNALLQQILKKRTLLERYKRCQALEGYFRERERLEEKLKVLSAFSEEDGERLKEFQVRQASLNQKMQEKKNRLKELTRELQEIQQKKTGLKEEIAQITLNLEKQKIRAGQYAHFNVQTLEEIKKVSERKKFLNENKEKIAQELRHVQNAYFTIQKDIESAKDKIISKSVQIKKLFYFCVAGFGLGLFSFILSFWFVPSIFLGLLCLLGTGFGGYQWFKGKKIIRQLELGLNNKLTQINAMDAQQKEKQAQLEEIKKEIVQCETNCFKFCQEARVKDLVTYEIRLKEKTEINQAIKENEQILKQKKEILAGINQAIERLDEKIAKIKREKEEIENSSEQIKKEINSILAKAGVEGISIYLSKLEEKKKLIAQKITLTKAIETSEIKDPQLELATLTRELAILQHLPENLENEFEIKKRIEELQSKLKAVSNEINQLMGRIETIRQNLSLPEAGVLNRLYLVKTKLKELETERKQWLGVYQILLDIEARAGESLVEIFKRASNWFAFVTDNRWKGVVLEKENIYALKNKQKLSVEQLSSGTRDQLYFAVRLAMAQAIMPKGFFLLLDDPFLTCDKERTKRLLHLLDQLAKHCQIILATKESWLKEAMRKGINIITLDSNS